MNKRAIRAIMKGTLLAWLQNRSFFFLLAFGWMIPPLVYLFVWSTAAEGTTIAGMTQAEFIGYYLLLIAVNQLTYPQTYWTVGDSIRDGRITVPLLRPLPLLLASIAEELAGKVVYMLFTIPVAILLALLLHPVLHLSLVNILVFILSLLLAWALRFFWGYWIALLAFWFTRADIFLGIQDSLTFLLAGQVAPVALLPGFLQVLAKVLPFRYMMGFPVEMLAGHLSTSDLITGLIFQCSWLVAAIVLYTLLWRNGVRRYTAVGG